MNRWDDQHLTLSQKLNTLKDLTEIERGPIIKEVMALLAKYQPNLLDTENAFDFPLNLKRRRWYDDDPYLWAMFNTLKCANKNSLTKVELFLSSALANQQKMMG
ncbi:hypothetical protein [Psychromonas sp. MME2]